MRSLSKAGQSIVETIDVCEAFPVHVIWDESSASRGPGRINRALRLTDWDAGRLSLDENPSLRD